MRGGKGVQGRKGDVGGKVCGEGNGVQRRCGTKRVRGEEGLQVRAREGRGVKGLGEGGDVATAVTAAQSRAAEAGDAGRAEPGRARRPRPPGRPHVGPQDPSGRGNAHSPAGSRGQPASRGAVAPAQAPAPAAAPRRVHPPSPPSPAPATSAAAASARREERERERARPRRPQPPAAPTAHARGGTSERAHAAGVVIGPGRRGPAHPRMRSAAGGRIG